MAVLRLCLLAAIAGLLARNLEAQPAAGENQVKAAYLLNFARFVEWRPDVLPDGAALQIGIAGDDIFGRTLEEVLRGKSVNGHPIRLRQLQWEDSLEGCHIVFIGASEEKHLAAILDRLGRQSVLTVSDIDRFSLRGGVIEFRMVGNRMRFDINRGPANEAHLTISSKLLSVARAVHQGRAAR